MSGCPENGMAETSATAPGSKGGRSLTGLVEGRERQRKEEKEKEHPLRGYLNKYSGKGPLKGFKRRWFVFSGSNCKLFYYRAKGDLLPLGEIDIRRATFSLNPFPNQSTSGTNAFVFTIISFDKQYHLEADRDTALTWLQQLQRLRREYIMNLAEKFGIKLTNYLEEEPEVKQQGSLHPRSESAASSTSIFYDCPEAMNGSQGAPRFSDCPRAVSYNEATASPGKHRGLSGMFNRVRSRAESFTIGPRSPRHSVVCVKCKENEGQLISVSDDLTAVENELQASREVIQLLQNQLDITTKEKITLQELCKKQGDGITDELLSTLTIREQEAGEATAKLKAQEHGFERMRNEKESLEAQVNQLKDQIKLLEDIVQVKDQTVITLTNEIFELETEKNSRSNSRSSSYSEPKAEPKEMQNLKDSVNAYQIQNEFLNKEIVELNEFRAFGEKRQQELQLKVHEWEAKCCQIQSKLLSLLKEINQSTQEDGQQMIANNESIKALVNRLLEESSLDIPLSWQKGNRSRNASTISSRSCEYDDLGFSNKSSDVVDPFLDINSKGSEASKKKVETDNAEENRYYLSWKVKWDAFVGALGSQQLVKSQELKVLLRSGVPQEYRCKIWRGCISLRVATIQNRVGPDYYQKLCAAESKPTGSKYDPAAKQIELDLLRTLPYNKHFENLESDGTARLRRVLIAYSRHNPAVGYCQGLNRLAAVSLLFMPEEDAFWCLVSIIETIMPRDYYSHNLLGAHVDQYVFRDLLAEKLPRIHYHFEVHGIEISLFSWFLTCFVDNIPVQVYLRIWDVFLYEGSKVLFRFALAFLKFHEEEMLKLNDSMSINQFLRTVGERDIDVRGLCRIAFALLNPFPMRKVEAKRVYYTNLVKGELSKLDEIRKSIQPQSHEGIDSHSD